MKIRLIDRTERTDGLPRRCERFRGQGSEAPGQPILQHGRLRWSAERSGGSRNQTDDVMLVRHFLKIVAQNPTKFKNPFHPPKKFPTMKVDGVYGDITGHWIIAFQQHLHTIGRPVLVDGVVDRVLNGVKLSPNKFIWTMVMLNITMGQVTGDELWDAGWKKPSVPPLLRDKIRDPATFFCSARKPADAKLPRVV